MCTNFLINPHNGKLLSRLVPAQCQNSLAPQLLSNNYWSKTKTSISLNRVYWYDTMCQIFSCYRFPACYLKIYLQWMFSTFSCLSNKANLKPLYFVVCLQPYKYINPQIPPSTTLSFKCVFSILQIYKSCHNPIISSWMFVISVHIAEILQVQIFKFYFTFQNIFSASNVRNNY